MLRVVRRRHVVAGPSLALIKWQYAGEHLQHGGLAGPVRSHQSNTVAARKRQVHTSVHRVIAVELAHVGQPYHFSAAARRFGERVVDFPGRPWQLNNLHFFELLQTALHLAGLGCLGAETLHKAHLLLHLAILPGGGSLFHLKGALAGGEVIVIVAPQVYRFVRLDGENPIRHLVQKSPVVRRDDHPALKGGQVLLKPQVCFKIQVVGWLIQQQNVGIPEQQPGEAGPHYPATTELVHGAEKIALLKAKPGEDRLGFVVPILTAGGLQLQVKLTELLQQIALSRRISLR